MVTIAEGAARLVLFTTIPLDVLGVALTLVSRVV
jgi:hypothetical protein